MEPWLSAVTLERWFPGFKGQVMLDRKTIKKLGGWEGYRVDRIGWPEGDSRTVTVYLKPSARTMYCQHCGSRYRQVHVRPLV